jgi:hypothetical protein
MKTCRIAVVGAQPERVARVIELLRTTTPDDESLLPFQMEYLPCVATFGHYYNPHNKDDGERIRYLAKLEYHGTDGRQAGSSLAPFWDNVDDDEHDAPDDSVPQRTKLAGIAGVAIGCGIETDSDVQAITQFFDTLAMSTPSQQQFQSALIDHIQPNAEFATMKVEMEAYKALDAHGKAEATRLGTMGPGKMANFVRNLAVCVIQMAMGEESTPKTDDPLQSHTFEESGDAISTVANDNPATELIQNDEPLLLPYVDTSKTRYACRICRSVLFGEDDLEYPRHVPHTHGFSIRKALSSSPSTCQSLFLACGMEWMGDLSDSQGKIHCPTCSAKVGVWNWSGAQCSCGTWVTPAIQIHGSKVDAILPVSLTSITTTSEISTTTLPTIEAITAATAALS